MRTEKDITVTSWDDLNHKIFSYHGMNDRFRSPFIFRGMSNADWGLDTSLVRLGHNPQITRSLEPVILRSFKFYSYQEASLGDSVWNWLALAQHHGLPTRLLDWSSSPFVALHFITTDPEEYSPKNPYKTDGVIWCVDVDKTTPYVPKEVRKSLGDDYAYIFNIDSLNRLATGNSIKTTLQLFDDLSPEEDAPFPLFFYPPALDSRIINQFGMFSMMSNPSASLSDWLIAHPECFIRFIIPADIKWEIRDRLDQINLSERVMYPGLDGISAWLKRYYSPRNISGASIVPPEQTSPTPRP